MASVDSPKEGTQSVPYVALGDSLTEGAQSLGVAAISQRYSYPQLIAEFLDIKPFGQPLLKGDLETYQAGYIGNPPNLELVLRRAESRLPKPVLAALREQSSITFGEQLDGAWEAIRAEVLAFLRAVESSNPDEFMVEQEGVHRPYQNLGVLNYTIPDITNTAYNRRDDPGSLWNLTHLGRLLHRAAENITSTWTAKRRKLQNPLVALIQDLAGALTSQVGDRMQSEKIRYVLEPEGETALQLAHAQQPHLVTLFIGNTEGPIRAALDGRMTNDQGKQNWEKVENIRTNLKKLLDAILAFESRPYVFIATLPSPTATPGLVRDRLGHWKPLIPPTPAYLTDGDLQELESVVSQYNDVIQDLASSDTGSYKRVWPVDVHSLCERMLRGTRREAEAARRAVAHGARIGGINKDEAQAILEAVWEGRPSILSGLGYSGQGQLLHTTSSVVSEKVLSSQQQHIKEIANRTRSPAAGNDQGPNVNDFRVILEGGRVYRLTGEYLATDARHASSVVQGGMVGLDGLHLTNTAYAYVARLFLQEMQEAHKHLGNVLEWTQSDGTRYSLPGVHKTAEDIDKMVLRVASEDSLLNNLPLLLLPLMDLVDALGEILGSVRILTPGS